MEWIADRIGNEYKEWIDGDSIFISAQTGSGKTYFILNVLLPYYAKQNKRILYLVNRTSLKVQLLEKEIRYKPQIEKQSINLTTYQEIEKKLCGYVNHMRTEAAINHFFTPNVMRNALEEYLNFDCVVCDEAHYFLSDSTFNNRTWISYAWVMMLFKNKVMVFISATIKDMTDYMKNDISEYSFDKTPWYSWHSNEVTRQNIVNKTRWAQHFKEIDDPDRDYSYLEIKIIKEIEKKTYADLLCELIEKNKQNKWLIFVDSKTFGNQLRKSIVEYFGMSRNVAEEDVVFLSADNIRDSSTQEAFGSIVGKEMLSSRVVISTAVLDNGVTIKDMELRDIVVFADMEYELIQMLGRKRKDGENLRVYLADYNRQHFVQRLNSLQRVRDIYGLYMKKFTDGMKIPLSELTNYDSRSLGTDPNMENVVKEWVLITRMSNDITSKLNDGSYSQEDINSVFYTLKHFYFLNPFSIKNIEARNIFYQKVLEAFKVDPENAFSKIQLSWLGITGEQAQKIIEDSRLSETERLRIKICKQIDAVLGKEMTEVENSTWKVMVKQDIRKYMDYMVPKENRTKKGNSAYNEIYKPKRPLTSGQMDYLREECGLPYAIKNLTIDGVYRYVFVRISDSIEL